MPIALILQGVLAGIQAAPQIEDVVLKGKAFITSLFSAGVITKEDQDAMHAHVDATTAAYLAGEVPPAWKVEADPK